MIKLIIQNRVLKEKLTLNLLSIRDAQYDWLKLVMLIKSLCSILLALT